MMRSGNIASLEILTEQFERLPGIGKKTAARLAYYVLEMPEQDAQKFADAIVNAHKSIHCCRICCNLTDKDLCPVCADENRDKSIICVVEDPRDVTVLERTGELNVSYHVLHGAISPMKGILPDMLKIKELLARLTDNTVKEVVMATNTTIEGETTAVYLSKLIKPLGIKVTRLAFGLPVGGDIQYADEITLAHAFTGRNEI